MSQLQGYATFNCKCRPTSKPFLKMAVLAGALLTLSPSAASPVDLELKSSPACVQAYAKYSKDNP